MRYFTLLINFSLLAANFQLATNGCSMSHCNSALNDAIGLLPPSGNVIQLYHDSQPSGSSQGLGVGSNGTVIAAVYSSLPSIKVYNYKGTIIWQDSTLDTIPYFCAPMIGTDNGVIACDDVQMIRYDPTGIILWDTCFYAGTAGNCKCADGVSLPPCITSNHPTSPIQLGDGTVVLETNAPSGSKGEIFQVNSSTGVMLGTTFLDPVGNNSYVTTNTPCAVGTRIFTITNLSSDVTLGRMYAIDINNGVFTIAWKKDVTGPSGGSPLCDGGNVYTDAVATNVNQGALYGWQQSDGTQLFACLNNSTCPPLQTFVRANSAKDPRGGYWTYATSTAVHTLQRRNSNDGTILQSINTNIVPGESCNLQPGSAMSMTVDSNSANLMIVELQTQSTCNNNAYIAGINVDAGTLEWYWKLPGNGNSAAGQFSILNGRVGFTTAQTGIFLIGSLVGGSSFGSGISISSGMSVQ